MRSVFLDFGTVSHDDPDTTNLERVLPGITLHPTSTDSEVDERIAGAEFILTNKLNITRARMQKGESMEAALARLRPPLFFKHKPAFEAQLGQMGEAQIEQALALIASAEARCKQTGSDPAIVSSRALLSLCQLASRAAARRRA